MSTFVKYTLLALFLVFIFLLLKSGGNFGLLAQTAGNQFSMLLRTLQGRDSRTGQPANVTIGS